MRFAVVDFTTIAVQMTRIEQIKADFFRKIRANPRHLCHPRTYYFYEYKLKNNE